MSGAVVAPRGPIAGGGDLNFPDTSVPGPPAPLLPGEIGKGATKSAIAAPSSVQRPDMPLDPHSAGKLWMRKWNLTVGTQSGKDAVDLSKLAFNFDVSKQLGQTLWKARITIYNIDSNLVARLQKTLTHVLLEAGYQAPSQQYGKIFAGPIAWFKYGRQNATDTYIELHAATGDEAVTQAVVNTTLPAGATQRDVVNACAAAMAPYGIGLGYITDLGKEKAPRGRVCFGMASDVLRDVVRSAGAHYHIDDDNKLHILKEFETFATEQVPVLNSQSGMLDVPAQTRDGGVEVHSLLNFAIRPGRRIHIDERDLVVQKASPSGDADNLPTDAQRLNIQRMGLNESGFYEVGGVQHIGENRGNPWFTYMMTAPIKPVKPELTTSA
jgi:hypothetical protein